MDNYIAIPKEDVPKYRPTAKDPEDITLRLHMGIGVGELLALHVGGVFKVHSQACSGSSAFVEMGIHHRGTTYETNEQCGATRTSWRNLYVSRGL